MRDQILEDREKDILVLVTLCNRCCCVTWATQLRMSVRKRKTVLGERKRKHVNR